MITRVCAYCNLRYDTFPSIKPKYCSAACAGAAKRLGGEGVCAQCGAPIRWAPSAPRCYCSKSCARTAANLTDRNPSRRRNLSGDRNPMFGKPGLRGKANAMHGRRKERAPRWKGGRKVRGDGYILVVAPDDHPYPADIHKPSGLKYILEHRLVMEQHLGRYLLPTEVVHHFDKNPGNNDIGNLILYASQAEHIREAHPLTAQRRLHRSLGR